jgi:hypothetical protein
VKVDEGDDDKHVSEVVERVLVLHKNNKGIQRIRRREVEFITTSLLHTAQVDG